MKTYKVKISVLSSGLFSPTVTEMVEFVEGNSYVNNPKICIKNLGTTFVCVCPECMEKSRKLMEEYMNQHLQT